MGSKRSQAEKPTCDVCRMHSFPESILSCHRCITVQHTFCLAEPLVDLPAGRWLCPACSQSSLRAYPSRRRTQPITSADNKGSGSSRVTDEGEKGARGQVSTRSSRAANGVVVVEMDANVRGGPTTRTRGGGAAAANAAAVAANGGGAGAHSAACSVGNKRPRRATRGGSLEKAAVEDTSAAEVVSVAIVDDGISSPAATQGDCSASSGGHSNGLATPDAEQERSDPGRTITLFCRRDFRRYLRWKQRELASQDDERRKEEQTRARKTFSSIIATNNRR